MRQQKVQNKKQRGAILVYLLIGLVIVVAILVVLLTRGRQPVEPVLEPVDSQVQKLQQLSPSDEVAAIEEDLQNTNLDQIDTELTEVDKSLQSL